VVQEIPPATQNQKTSTDSSGAAKESRSSSRPDVLRYAPAAVVLFGLTIFLLFTNLIDLIIITLPVAVAVSTVLIGKIFSNRNRPTLGALFRTYICPASSFSFFFVAIALAGIAYIPAYVFDPVLNGYLVALPAIVLLFNAAFLNSFGNWLVKTRVSDQYKGLVIKRVAGGLAFFFFFVLASGFPPYNYFGFPFLLSGIAYSILAVSPVLAFSNRFTQYSQSGQYLMNSTGQWTAVAFLIGIAGAIISLPFSNIYTYVGVLILAMIGVGYIGARMYALGSERLNKIQQEVYQKHVHQLQIVNSPDFRFLGNATEAFVSSGHKENILIALSTLLANAGLEYNESSLLLSNISNYEVPPIFRIAGLSVKKGLEYEIQRRIAIMNATMIDISQRVSSRKIA